MPPSPDATPPGPVDLYTATYSRFAEDLYSRIRREAMGEDIGQNSWLTADEHDLFIDWLGLRPDDHLLDVACGSGGPTLRIAHRVGCRVRGIDLHEHAVAQANRFAAERSLADRASFSQADAAAPLPFDDHAFSAILCVDAINHIPDRAALLREWRRLLRPGGRLLFADPIVVTGPLTNAEIAARASIGFFLFVPPGLNEALLADAGFALSRVEDRTGNMARIARRWTDARARHEADLRRIEGDDAYAGLQRFLDIAATLAEQRRMSRFVFAATA